jgi:hypothetical protein
MARLTKDVSVGTLVITVKLQLEEAVMRLTELVT